MNTYGILKITILFCVFVLTPIEVKSFWFDWGAEHERGKDILQFIILMQCIVYSMLFKYQMLLQILISHTFIDCTGTLRLYTHSGNETEISSSSYEGLSSRRQIGKSARALRSKSLQGFAYVSLEGNCCWKIREKRNGRGSNEYLTHALNFHEPGWTIRSFEVLDSCEHKK